MKGDSLESPQLSAQAAAAAAVAIARLPALIGCHLNHAIYVLTNIYNDRIVVRVCGHVRNQA